MKQYKNTVQTIQKHNTNNTEHNKYKYTCCQNTHTLQNSHLHPNTLQTKLKQPQYKIS